MTTEGSIPPPPAAPEPAEPPPAPPTETASPPPAPPSEPAKGRRWGRIALVVGAVVIGAIVIASLGQDDDPDASPSQVAGASQPDEPEASRTPEPVSDPAPTPTPGPAFEDISLTGTGDSVPSFEIPEGAAAIAQVTHDGSSNFAVVSLAADGSDNDLLVNVIGNYSGTVLFDESSGVHSVALEITADGAWTIVIKPVTSARSWDSASALNGSGDDVVQVNPQTSGLVTVAIQHTGESNFAVIGYSSSGSDLMVNEIGSYAGEVPMASGTILLEVTADGSWTIASS
jgi:hypothetical protein